LNCKIQWRERESYRERERKKEREHLVGTDGKIDSERINVRKREERERLELKEFEVAE
jgi:hypothetical protein